MVRITEIQKGLINFFLIGFHGVALVVHKKTARSGSIKIR